MDKRRYLQAKSTLVHATKVLFLEFSKDMQLGQAQALSALQFLEAIFSNIDLIVKFQEKLLPLLDKSISEYFTSKAGKKITVFALSFILRRLLSEIRDKGNDHALIVEVCENKWLQRLFFEHIADCNMLFGVIFKYIFEKKLACAKDWIENKTLELVTCVRMLFDRYTQELNSTKAVSWNYWRMMTAVDILTCLYQELYKSLTTMETIQQQVVLMTAACTGLIYVVCKTYIESSDSVLSRVGLMKHNPQLYYLLRVDREYRNKVSETDTLEKQLDEKLKSLKIERKTVDEKKVDRELRLCAWCLKYQVGATKLKRCSLCLSVFYCSTECQKADWAAGHKKTCKPAESIAKDS